MAEKQASVTYESPSAYNADREEVRDTIIKNDTVIMKYEKKAEEAIEAFHEYFSK
jgi:hypothetical protein